MNTSVIVKVKYTCNTCDFTAGSESNEVEPWEETSEKIVFHVRETGHGMKFSGEVFIETVNGKQIESKE